MRNAIRYSDRITIGAVPTSEDLDQLRDLAYRTLIDLRSKDERFGQNVERASTSMGLDYVSIPIAETEITIEGVSQFYDAVHLRETGPMYVFSRFGKRPLALLVLYDVISRGEPAVKVFERGARHGVNLEGDLHLQPFLVKASRDEGFRGIVSSIHQRIEKTSSRRTPGGGV